MPIYSNLAAKLTNNKNIVIARVDAIKYKIPGFKITFYPTIKFFKKGSQSKVIDYYSGRNVDAFISFLKLNTSLPWQENIKP